MWTFFSILITAMLVRETIYILIYLDYTRLGRGRPVSSFIEKMLIFLTEIFPSLIISVYVVFMLQSARGSTLRTGNGITEPLDEQENLESEESEDESMTTGHSTFYKHSQDFSDPEDENS